MPDNDRVMKWFFAYGDKFKSTPDVTIIRMNDDNDEHFVAAVKKAIDTDTPINEAGWENINQLTFDGLYDDGTLT